MACFGERGGEVVRCGMVWYDGEIRGDEETPTVSRDEPHNGHSFSESTNRQCIINTIF